jgi:hypothetical protein
MLIAGEILDLQTLIDLVVDLPEGSTGHHQEIQEVTIAVPVEPLRRQIARGSGRGPDLVAVATIPRRRPVAGVLPHQRTNSGT